MKKSVILPLVGLLCLTVTALTGIKIDEDTQDQVATALAILVSFGVTLWGIYKDFKKKKGDDK